jgi:hypothetical protein
MLSHFIIIKAIDKSACKLNWIIKIIKKHERLVAISMNLYIQRYNNQIWQQ